MLVKVFPLSARRGSYMSATLNDRCRLVSPNDARDKISLISRGAEEVLSSVRKLFLFTQSFCMAFGISNGVASTGNAVVSELARDRFVICGIL